MIFLLSTSIWILTVHLVAGAIWRSDEPPVVFAGGKITPMSTIPYRDSVALQMTFDVPPIKAFPLITIVDSRPYDPYRQHTSADDKSFENLYKQRAQGVTKYISHLCPDYNQTDHSHRCFPNLWKLQLYPFPKTSWKFNGHLMLNEKVEIELPQQNSTPPLSQGNVIMLQNITEMQKLMDLRNSGRQIVMGSDGTPYRISSEVFTLINASLDAATSFLRLQILDHGAMMCSQGHLSQQLLPPDKLSAALSKVKDNLSKRKLEPIVSGMNASVYYRIDIKACEFHGSEFSVTLEIPLGKNSSDLSVTGLKKLQKLGMYFVEPVPMRLGVDICMIIKYPFLVAVLDGKTTFLPENYCRNPVKDEIFCRLSQASSLTDYEPCLGPLFPNTQALLHVKKCTPVCYPVEAPYVTLNRPNVAWVTTHPEHPLALQCSRSGLEAELSLDIPDVDIGGLEIDLSCACCDIVYNGTVLLSKLGHACDEQSLSDCKMYHLVPMQWTLRKEYSITDLLGPRPCVIQEKTVLTEDGIRRKFFPKDDKFFQKEDDESTSDRRFYVLLTAVLSVVFLTLGLIWYVFLLRGKRLRDLGPFMTAGFRRRFGHRNDVGVAMRCEESAEVVISAETEE